MNAFLNFIGRMLFAPFGAVHPVLTILVLSVVIGAGSLLVFKWTSNQEKIRAAKAPMKAHLLGILLFRNDLRMVFKSLGMALFHSLANLRFIVVPMLVMIVPLVLIFVQMEFRLGSEGIAPGAATVLRVHLKDGANPDDVTLEAPDGVAVETPGVRVRDGRNGLFEVDFRLRGKVEGTHEIVVRTGEGEVTKSVTVAKGPAFVSPLRPQANFLDSVFYPVEPPVPARSPIESIEVHHEVATYAFLGIDWAWWSLFLVFMILALFALRGPMGIDF
jgi:hypothetical protein